MADSHDEKGGFVAEDVHERTADDADMERMNVPQLFRRGFNATTLTSFMVVASCSWAWVLNGASLGLNAGGSGGVIWVTLGTCIFWGLLILSLAEMASMVPLSGGPYHWVSTFAAPAYRQFLSYTAGWLLTMSWQCGTATTAYICGLLIRMTITIGQEEPDVQPWQTYCLAVAVNLICLFFITVGMRYLQLFELASGICYIVGFISIIVAYAVLAPKTDAHAVFTTFTDGGGWGSVGFAALCCQEAALYFVIGTDGAAHMAEETRDASVSVPRAMVWSYVITVVTAMGMLILFCFCYTDAALEVGAATGYAFMGVNYAATGSAAGAKALTCVVIVPMILALANFMAASGRQLYAFARDGGVPFGNWITHVPQGVKYPRNAVLTTFSFGMLLPLISLGSSVAFYALVSLTLSAYVATYLFATCVLIHRRLAGPSLPPARWSLGRFGMPTNVVGAVYGILLLTFTLMPPTPGFDPTTFNWAPVILGSIMAIAMLLYVYGMRKTFKVPHLKDDASF